MRRFFGNRVTDKSERRHARGRTHLLAQRAPAHRLQHSPPSTLQALSIRAETEADTDADADADAEAKILTQGVNKQLAQSRSDWLRFAHRNTKMDWPARCT